VTLALLLSIPVTQLLIFGFAVNLDVKHVAATIFDQSRTQESRELVAAFQSSGYYDVKSYANSPSELERMIVSGRARVGVTIPPDYARKLKNGRQAQVRVVIDATDAVSANMSAGAAQAIGLLKSQRLITEKMLRSGVRLDAQAVDMRIRPWYNPDFITAWYITPGIMGMVLVLSLVMTMSMAIVREDELGTLELLVVSPMQPWELLASKCAPFVLIGCAEVALAALAGILFFNMPFAGSVPLFFLLTLFYVFADLALGIAVSTISRSRMQAMQISVCLVLPSVLLSGFIFPRDSMPAVFRALSLALPITYYIRGARQIMLKGGGFAMVWRDALALFCYAAAAFMTGVALFRQRYVP